MAGFDNPDVVQKAVATRLANLEAKRSRSLTLEEVEDRIEQTRLAFTDELMGLNPRKLAKELYSYLAGEKQPTKEAVALWKEFLPMLMPKLTVSETKTEGEGGGGVQINIQPPGATAPIVEVTATKVKN